MRCSDDLQRLFPKVLHDARSRDRPYAFDQPRSEVLLDAAHRCRNDGFVRQDLELPAEFRVLNPHPLHFQHLAGPRRNEIAYGGHRIAPSGHPHFGHGKACFLVEKGDPFDLTVQFDLPFFIDLFFE